MSSSPTPIGAMMVVVVVMLTSVGRTLLLTGVIYRSPLCNTIIMTLPHDVSILREAQKPFDCFPESVC